MKAILTIQASKTNAKGYYIDLSVLRKVCEKHEGYEAKDLIEIIHNKGIYFDMTEQELIEYFDKELSKN